MLDMKDICCILETAKEKSITKAADNLFLTRSAVSQNISRVEKELGFALFNRTNRNVKLTEAGTYFMENAEELINTWKLFLKKMNTFSATEKERGTLNISLLSLAVYSELPQIISRFKVSHPNWKVNFFNDTDLEIHASLLSGERDFYFVHASTSAFDHQPDIAFVPLAYDTLSILLCAQDPLSTKEIVHMEDLFRYHMLTCNPDLINAFPKNLQLNCSIYEDSFLPALITNPGDFSLMPKSRCASILKQYSNLCAKPFETADGAHQLTLYLVYRASLPNVEQHPFYQYIIDYYLK